MQQGREGHARFAVLTVIPEEMDEALNVLGASEEVGETAVFTSPLALQEGLTQLPFVVARCRDRSNGPAGITVRDLLEDWHPEVILLVGIAGGIRRLSIGSNPPKLADGPALGDVVLAKMIHFADYGKDLPNGFLPRWLPLTHPSARLVQNSFDVLHRGVPWMDALPDWPSKDHAPRVHEGEVLAVESVAGNPFGVRQQQMIEYFSQTIAVDMESKGVAEAIFAYDRDVYYNPRWLCIRGISDLVVGSAEAAELLKAELGDNSAQREEWRIPAARSAALCANWVLVRLLKQGRPRLAAQTAVPPWKHAGEIGWLGRALVAQ